VAAVSLPKTTASGRLPFGAGGARRWPGTLAQLPEPGCGRAASEAGEAAAGMEGLTLVLMD